jgi:hypothetical protein
VADKALDQWREKFWFEFSSRIKGAPPATPGFSGFGGETIPNQPNKRIFADWIVKISRDGTHVVVEARLYVNAFGRADEVKAWSFPDRFDDAWSAAQSVADWLRPMMPPNLGE